MPLPLIPLASFLAANVTRILAGVGLGALASGVGWDDLKREVYDWIIAEAAARGGLHLNHDEPLSESSITAAVSEKIGIPLRSLRDPQTLDEDLSDWAAGFVSQKVGYQIRSIRDVDMLKEDMLRIGGALLTEHVGVPAGLMDGDDGFNVEVIKMRLLMWAQAEIMSNIQELAGPVLEQLKASLSLDTLAASMNEALVDLDSEHRVTADSLAIAVANRLAVQSITNYQRVVQDGSKKLRRKRQVAEAQKRFHQRHGQRRVYVPVGWDVSVNPPAGGG